MINISYYVFCKCFIMIRNICSNFCKVTSCREKRRKVAQCWCRTRGSRVTILLLALTIVIIIHYMCRTTYYQNLQEYAITWRLIEEEIEEALKMDKGTGCEIPYLDPFAKEIMQFDKKLPKITCDAEMDWVKCYLSKCRVVDAILSTMDHVVCNYQDIVYYNDFKYIVADPIAVPADHVYTLYKSDHVKITCKGTSKESFKRWTGHAAGFRRTVERKPVPPNRENTYNVLILGFDSTSRNGFIRKMPKTHHYLKNVLQATILESYNIVGDGTPAAHFPLLTGKTEMELPDVRKITRTVIDNNFFIFEKLKNDGYRTAYFEDMPSIGTFQYRLNGFEHQPADHYLRAFFLEDEKSYQWWPIFKRKYNYCVGDTPHYQLMLNLTDQFLRLDGKRFCFTFFTDISHDDFNMISTADDATVQLFQTLLQRNTFDDTLLIVMGDHGPRYTDVRNTLQGKMEERLPLMGIRLPEKLKRSRPAAQARLEDNANTLTTPRDIHATVLDVLDWTQHLNPYTVRGADLPRAISLLQAIPKTRSCSEAGIQPHWCACVKWKNVTDDAMVQKAAQEFLHFINELTDAVRDKCVLRKVTEVLWLMEQQPNPGVLAFTGAKDIDGFEGKFDDKPRSLRVMHQIKVAVAPGHGIFEASMTYLKSEDRFLVNTRDISRINAYGHEPDCVLATHPHLNMYCYCNDYLP